MDLKAKRYCELITRTKLFRPGGKEKLVQTWLFHRRRLAVVMMHARF